MIAIEVLEFRNPGDILIRVSGEAEKLRLLEDQMREFYSKASPPLLRNPSKGQVTDMYCLKFS